MILKTGRTRFLGIPLKKIKERLEFRELLKRAAKEKENGQPKK